MFRAGGVGGDERQVDLGLHQCRELDLGSLGRLTKTLKGHSVLLQVDALFLLELLGDPFDDLLVEVVAAEMCVAVGGLDLEHALAYLKDGDVERAAAQIVDRDGLFGLLVETVRQ